MVEKENRSPATERQCEETRRSFLKKSVYAAPTLMVLGGLVKPQSAHAFGNPPSDPATTSSTSSQSSSSDDSLSSSSSSSSGDSLELDSLN